MATPELQTEVLRWRKDPRYFAETVLGVGSLWKKQAEILEAIRDHRRVAVPSCFESGVVCDETLSAPRG
jgi:hypothetical protein